ncbi:uncharacterized protein LAESUDRAFT_724620 [Laetiporus sulphureus 93-53]|uniref:Uncharacterized protein n=1 Tax=Laetiporus sulphureus 93-53 TaxID=1314785 RepID=A0A165ERX4_9APHY|nr:uncharacterized protein LAESUDRAFT_724620 [Laetiporus sulphureus 93-53]KZT07644.1 hypothetical protein LAESUDRAFT_724620 [Laetiporus sulphureus 93-53]
MIAHSINGFNPRLADAIGSIATSASCVEQFVTAECTPSPMAVEIPHAHVKTCGLDVDASQACVVVPLCKKS